MCKSLEPNLQNPGPTAPCARAGVLPFAKRGDDRGNNLIRLQQMFPRIVAAEFQQPLHVSRECQHLLSRMLTPDPARRITIGEIMQHSWCGASPVVLRVSTSAAPEYLRYSSEVGQKILDVVVEADLRVQYAPSMSALTAPCRRLAQHACSVQ